LLYPKYANAYLLAGKAMPEAKVQAILDSGALLEPDSCNWHYVEGLTIYDDPRLALFWDKTGLGHFGQRHSQGGHTVLLLDGERRHIAADEWPHFLQKQQDLLAQRRDGSELRIDGSLPEQRVEAQLRVMDGYLYGRVWRSCQPSSGRMLAYVDKEPEAGGDGSPVVSTAELRTAKVVTEKGQVRFVLKSQEIVFDGTNYQFK
jgi:hypothetical protein